MCIVCRLHGMLADIVVRVARQLMQRSDACVAIHSNKTSTQCRARVISLLLQ